MTPLPVLEDIRIASPCRVPWEGMKGDDRVRFCGQCRLNVYNLSAMTRTEAQELLRTHVGHLCVQIYRRADGTVLTQDCPVGLRALRMRMAKRVAWLGACLAAGIAMIANHLGLGAGKAANVLPASVTVTPTEPIAPVGPLVADIAGTDGPDEEETVNIGGETCRVYRGGPPAMRTKEESPERAADGLTEGK